jgi:hypothetical protein
MPAVRYHNKRHQHHHKHWQQQLQQGAGAHIALPCPAQPSLLPGKQRASCGSPPPRWWGVARWQLARAHDILLRTGEGGGARGL